MQTPLSNELYWLALTLLMTALFWIPYVLNRFKEHGILPVLTDPHLDLHPQAEWAARMMKAHGNAVENLAVFAPLVIAVEITGSASGATATACMLYFFARLAHYVVYTLGLPYVRTIAFLLGFVCQIALGLALLA